MTMGSMGSTGSTGSERRVAGRRGHWGLVLVAAAFGLAGGMPLPAAAQFGGEPQIASEREDVNDPPGRAGRLALVQGSVWLFHPEAGEWMAAERNRPLTSGDRLSTDADGRIELRIGSTSLRIDGNSELELVRLDDSQIEVYLHNGSLATRVRSNEAARELVLSTDDGRFTVEGVGHYRLDRRADLSQLSVWSGQARYEGPQSALSVYAGQRADFWLDASQRAQYSLGTPQRDGFAAWAGEMDRADEARTASRYVSPEMTGIEDLDRYGRWEQDPEYGALWLPREVPVGWAPYAAGHWAWVSPWGWTWVDDAPWGFAPFHYGRWVWARNNWGWAPGRYVARPVYAPALVGWIGGSGLNLSVTIGGGPAVGWFPLAPREAWVPQYRVSPRYVRTVNGPHFRNGGDIERLIQSPSTVLRGIEYRNRKFHHGTTATPLQAFQQRGRYTPVQPAWRGSAVARDFERLPASPIGVVARPDWLRPGAPALRNPAERREGWRDERRDSRNDNRNDGRVDPRERRDARDGRDGRDARNGNEPRGGRDQRGDAPRDPRAPAAPALIGAPGAVPGFIPPQPAPAQPRLPGGERVGERPGERAGERNPWRGPEGSNGRANERLPEPGGERPGDLRNGRSRPVQPPMSAPDPRPAMTQPVLPSAAPVQPAPPAARVEPPQADPRLTRPDRPVRNFESPERRIEQPDRPARPERPERGVERPSERMPAAPPAMPEAPRMAPPRAVAPPAVVPPPAPPVAPQLRPPAPPPAVAPPAQPPRELREGRDGREPREGRGEGGRPGRPQQ